MQAGLLRHWQRRLQQSNQVRSETAAAISRQLPLRLPQGSSHPYLRLPIYAPTPQRRARIHSLAQSRGLGVSLAYPAPINEIPEISGMFDGKRYPAARRVSEHLLTIPTHQWLSAEDKQAIVKCVQPPSLQ
jgi:dTDP-4-amino-4,6-dideoxygalactose transaminase